MILRVCLLLALALVLFAGSSASARNPFLSSPDNATEPAPAIESTSPAADKKTDSIFRRFAGELMREIVVLQHRLKKELTSVVSSLRESFSLASLFVLLGGSFLYGLVHAAGPGHGKAAAAAYITACRGSLRQALLLGLAIGVFHAASATLLVLGLHFILERTIMLHFEESSRIMQIIGYGAIACIGIVMFSREIFDFLRKSQSEAPARPAGNKSLLGTAALVGIVPCPGAALVLVFALTVSAPLSGVASVAAMSLGMGTTIALVAAATSLCRSFLSRALSESPRASTLLASVFGLLGSAAITLFGTLMLLAVLQDA
jgi:ABC-type nickel/cobalt efflux system permease component RcnA